MHGRTGCVPVRIGITDKTYDVLCDTGRFEFRCEVLVNIQIHIYVLFVASLVVALFLRYHKACMHYVTYCCNFATWSNSSFVCIIWVFFRLGKSVFFNVVYGSSISTRAG